MSGIVGIKGATYQQVCRSVVDARIFVDNIQKKIASLKYSSASLSFSTLLQHSKENSKSLAKQYMANLERFVSNNIQKKIASTS